MTNHLTNKPKQQDSSMSVDAFDHDSANLQHFIVVGRVNDEGRVRDVFVGAWRDRTEADADIPQIGLMLTAEPPAPPLPDQTPSSADVFPSVD